MIIHVRPGISILTKMIIYKWVELYYILSIVNLSANNFSIFPFQNKKYNHSNFSKYLNYWNCITKQCSVEILKQYHKDNIDYNTSSNECVKLSLMYNLLKNYDENMDFDYHNISILNLLENYNQNVHCIQLRLLSIILCINTVSINVIP